MSPLHVVGTLLLSLLASTVSSHYVKGGDIDISQNTVAGTGSNGFASSSSFSSSGSYSQASSGSFQTAHVSGPIPAGVVRTQFANHPPLVHSAAVSASGVAGSSHGHHASISSEINSGSVKSPIDASRNPYLNGQITSANLGPIPGCSGTSCSTEIKTHHFSSTEIKPVNVANNPYLNGEYKSGHISAGSFNQQYELGTGASQQVDVGKNPFLSGKVTGTQAQIPQHGAAGCGNAPGGSCLGTASVSLSKKPIDATNNPFLNQNYKSDTSGHFQQGSSGHSQQGSSGHSQHTLSGHAQQSLTGHGHQSSSGQAQQTGTSHQINYGNNPFLTGNVPSTQGHPTQSGCSGAPGGACSGGSGTYTGTNKQDNTLIHGQTSSSHGQFSQSTGGQTSSTGSGCTGAPGTPCSGSTSGNTLIIGSNNPFLSGQVPSSQGHFSQQPIGGHPSSSSSGCTGAPGSSCSDTGSSLAIGSNNPFLSGQKPTNQGCDGKLGSSCSSGGTVTIISGQTDQLSGGHVGTSQGSNQLGGQSGPGCSGSPGSPGCSGSPSIISNNPFLNGQVPSSQGQNPYQPTEQGCGGLPGSSCTGSGQNKPISGGPINIGNNPFFNNNNNKPSQSQHFGSTTQQQQPINAGLNPFLNGQKPTQHQPIPSTIPGQSQQGPKPIPDRYPGQQQQKPISISNQFPGQPQPIPTTYPGQPAPKGSSCSGAGYICVVKEKCINGLVDNYGQGLMQVRTSTQYCNPTTEVCCRLPNGPGTTLSFSSETQFKSDSQSSGSHSSSGFFSTNGNEIPQETVGSPVRSPFGNNALIPGSQISSGIINVPPKTNGGLIHIVPGPSPTFISPAELAGGRVQLPPGSKQGPAYIPPEPTPIQPKPTPDSPYRPSTLPPYQIQSTTYTPSTQPPNKFPPNQPPTQPPYTPSGSSLYPETRVPTSYLPPVSGSTTTQKPGNTYLPPYTGEIIDEVYLNTKTTPKTSSTTPEPGPAGSETKPNFLLPPTNPPVIRPPIETSTRAPIAPPTEPHAGCAAALKCVSIDHCTAEGVISETVVHLTREQHELRVPLTDCKDIDSGFIGKCCRDPTYKDPWPAGQLGLWNPNNGFDDGSYKSDKATNGRYKPNNNNRGPNNNNFNGQVNLPTFIPGNEGRVPGNFNNVPKAPGSQIPGRFPGNQFPGSIPNFVGQGSNQFNVDRPYDPLPSASGTCGVRRYDSTPKGIGPLDASFGEIPWQAMILRDTNRSLLCGGAIIRPDAVITSARCVEGLPVNDILVKGGEWRLGIDEEPKPFQIIKVLTIVTHPEYASNTLMNDVAILFLAEKFRLDKHIDTICLPPENEQIEATYGAANCITTGWGKEVLRIHIQNSLPHRIGINLLQPSQCKSTLSTNYANQLYQYNQKSCVCGTPSVPNNDICDVDQGSALACDLGDGHYRLTGIYSWDTGCLAPGSTQIASFVRLDVPWINLVLGTPVQQFLQQSGSAVPGFSIPAPVKGRPHVHQQVPQPNYYQTQQQQHQQHIDSGVPCECEGK